MRRRVGIALVLSFTCACGPSIDDSVRKLGAASVEERETGRQELLLAKDRAVDPLLEALENPLFATGRPQLAEVLVGLLTRVDDPRIEIALLAHLETDPDPRVKARIAHKFGLFQHTSGIEALFAALEDTDGEVRFQSIWALGQMADELDRVQVKRLREDSRRLATDPHRGAKREATIRVEGFVDAWIQEARKRSLRGQLAEAESLFAKAVAYSPSSKRANYRMARFYFDNYSQDKGLQLLRQHGMVLDAPKLREAPVIDGQMNEPLWQQAACADSFFQYSSEHFAAVPSDVRTRICVAYDEEDLYVGFQGFDAAPDSIVARISAKDGLLWYDDIVEIFIDPGFDHRGYLHVGINSNGAVSDGWVEDGVGERDVRWDAAASAAAYVGRDHWSVEYRLSLGQEDVPRPRTGDLWGLNFVRVFRGSEYSQWVRTYTSGGHSPDDFGILRFN